MPSYGGILQDTKGRIKKAIGNSIKKYDVIILSGGVSEGDYDFVPSILKEAGFDILFDSIAIQPGRPTIFGVLNKKRKVYCIGLPGNPVSTYLIFEILLKPFLYRLMGHDFKPLTVILHLARQICRRKKSRDANIPVKFVAPDKIVPVDYHGSAHINAMVDADGILTIPAGTTLLEKGKKVYVRLL